jgi:hypothetical protein
MLGHASRHLPRRDCNNSFRKIRCGSKHRNARSSIGQRLGTAFAFGTAIELCRKPPSVVLFLDFTLPHFIKLLLNGQLCESDRKRISPAGPGQRSAGTGGGITLSKRGRGFQ